MTKFLRSPAAMGWALVVTQGAALERAKREPFEVVDRPLLAGHPGDATVKYDDFAQDRQHLRGFSGLAIN